MVKSADVSSTNKIPVCTCRPYLVSF